MKRYFLLVAVTVLLAATSYTTSGNGANEKTVTSSVKGYVMSDRGQPMGGMLEKQVSRESITSVVASIGVFNRYISGKRTVAVLKPLLLNRR